MVQMYLQARLQWQCRRSRDHNPLSEPLLSCFVGHFYSCNSFLRKTICIFERNRILWGNLQTAVLPRDCLFQWFDRFSESVRLWSDSFKSRSGFFLEFTRFQVLYNREEQKWRCPWCNGYRRRKWTRRYEFKSWTRLIAFHIALMPLGKVWILPPAMGK